MRLHHLRPLLALPLVLAACGRDAGEDRERRETRVAASRNACVAEELAIRARENLASLDTIAAMGGGVEGPMRAAYTYAQVYRNLAELRHSSMAYVDSALGAPTPADSARYMQRAAQFSVRAPEPETVDANVAAEWRRNFATTRGNPEHYCNQAPPPQAEKGRR
ncbi:MAG TPA: hypothetical protein VGR37_18045 [Longimicrobiaceae bacterium]|nr:hypothetical protein [Longimicrobiaceae bacterium]